mgnify:CR=1 FL=1
MSIAKSRNESVISVFENDGDEISICVHSYMGDSNKGHEFSVVEYSEDIVSIPYEDLDGLIKQLQKLHEKWNGGRHES